ncbi:hypothetical protein SAMN05216223_13137 [Actinacidiphila yanglinensis]|uniref:Uncharacterized protein n=1 Tax=Actinacidiphila yanglinensis TaxID=310779 RepID=A0A1H6EDF4_9ACTN|nr:hypothetical protein SAMN05216223_13137 [Actinacidiphila yanglinensis]
MPRSSHPTAPQTDGSEPHPRKASSAPPHPLTGARILAAHDNGAVPGHPAALPRLQADDLITNRRAGDGAHRGVRLPGRVSLKCLEGGMSRDHLVPPPGTGAAHCSEGHSYTVDATPVYRTPLSLVSVGSSISKRFTGSGMRRRVGVPLPFSRCEAITRM